MRSSVILLAITSALLVDCVFGFAGSYSLPTHHRVKVSTHAAIYPPYIL
jgi:hypothetical protein